MSLFQALSIVLVTGVLGWAEMWFAFPMIMQPLVLGPVVGLLLGDLGTGVLCGATCQLIFLGVMGIGGTIPPDSIGGTIIGTAFAIVLGQGVETAMAIAMPAAILGSFLFLATTVLRGFINPLIEKLCDRGDDKGLERLHVLASIIPSLPGHVVTFVILYFGGNVVQDLVPYVPEWLTAGLGVASGMMVAVGIALLLRMMWSKSMAVYFFLGFLLVSFLNVPLIGVACLGIVLALILYLEKYKKNAKDSAAGATNEEEALFND